MHIILDEHLCHSVPGSDGDTTTHLGGSDGGSVVTKDETRRGYILDGSVVAREIAIS